VNASCPVSEIIPKRLKPYSDGEFVKECLEVVGDIICPDKKKTLSVCHDLVSRRINYISQMVEAKLHDLPQKFEAFSIAVDGSTDVVDTAQLAIFIICGYKFQYNRRIGCTVQQERINNGHRII
jgi:hypothetical protein